MPSGDPFVLIPRDAVAKIAASSSARGTLTLGYVRADEMYVVQSVETAPGIRFPADIPREFVALRVSDTHRAGQWITVSGDDSHLMHFHLSRRPRTQMKYDAFRELVAGVQDPGKNLGVLVTYAPHLSTKLAALGVPQIAGWAITREGVTPLPLEIEPEVVGLAQMSQQWPVEHLATNSIMVVGCGSIGSAAAEALAGYGVGRVELVDPDRFLWHNMLRHTLGPESVGRLKVAALKDHLARRWPEQTVVPHARDVVAEAHYLRPLVERVDLVLCAADGIAPRRVVSHLARRAQRPAVLACVLDSGSVGEVIRLRPTPRFGCLLCLRSQLAGQGAMDAEADQELDYGTGRTHQPMTAVPPDLKYVGLVAAKVAVATLLESLHGDHRQRIPEEHALIGLRPAGDLAAPFDLAHAGDVRWSSIPSPRGSCPTCSPA